MVAEVIEVMRQVGEGPVFKTNFKKAYNYVDWDFLIFELQKMSYGASWIGWMRTCVMCARVSVLVNRSAGEEFWMYTSLRQGYPLSLLLFNLVGETLLILVN